jgi:hypothetical protein
LRDGAQYWVGSADDCGLRLADPSLPAHVAILEQRDGHWWLTAVNGPVRVAGMLLSNPQRLFPRDVIEFAPSHRYEFLSGDERTVRMNSVADMLLPLNRRKHRQRKGPRTSVPWLSLGLSLLSLLLLLGAGYVFWYGRARTAPTTAVLTERQAQQLDSLLVAAYDHIERGSSLLELGLREGASQEFARAINTLALSDLRDNPQVKPRIEGMESAVAAIYREQQLAVPDAYIGARTTLSLDEARDASLTREEFATAFALVSAAYRARFGQSIEVTGRDHAEHVSLYGKGGAIDLRSSTMNREQVNFVIDQCKSHKIRIKDFSRDSVLQAQVKAAVKAGLLDRAGTGLHLHIDRFAKNRDRWTVGYAPEMLPERRYTSMNFSRDIPASENSVPSASSVGVPRSRRSSSI